MEKQKIKLEDLSGGSTPCEICVAMNSREIVLNETRDYYNRCDCAIIGNVCLDKDRAMIKLLYLNYKNSD